MKSHPLTIFFRMIRTGGKNFMRNAWLSIAATAVMVVALTIILSAIVLNVTAHNAIKELSKDFKVSIYLKDDVTEAQRAPLEKALKANPATASVEYVSIDTAKARFSDSFQNDQKLLEGLSFVGGNSLPASFEVSTTDINKITQIGEIAKKNEYKSIVDSVTLGKTDAKKTIDRAASARRFIVNASIFSALLFAGVSVLIIFNTIRMAIFTRSNEIEIMKLIGATPNYIRGPFLVEASMYGIIAGLLANSAVYAAILSLGSKVSTQAEFSATYAFFTDPKTVLMMLGGAICAGVLVAVISSSLAMEKYLRLKKW